MSDPGELRLFAQHDGAAWCSQDPAGVAAHYAPGGSLTVNGGTPAVGRAAIMEAARRFMTALPDIEVVMEWTLARDGLIADSQGHYDQAEYDRRLEHGSGELA